MPTRLSLTDAAPLGMTTAVYAREKPDAPAVISDYGSRTFAEMNDHANQLVRVLRDAGLAAGDSVALLSRNRPEFLEVFMAALRSGLRVTPINWHLTGEEVGYIVDNCEARAFIADGRFPGPATQALRLAPGVVVALMFGGSADDFADYEETLASMDAEDIKDPVLGTQMLYTSGTTGRPKGVYRKQSVPLMPNHDPAALGYDPASDVVLCTGPAYHAAPLLIDVLTPHISGLPIVMMDKWEARETLRLIEEHRVSHCHMVATMFHRLLQLPEEVKAGSDISSMKRIVHGAAPCPVHVKRAMIDWFGPVLLEYYAATEGGGGFFISSEEWLQKPGSVGRPGPEFDNRILDDEGREVPPGEVGTIYMRAPEVGRFEYYRDRDKTADSYLGDHFTLGDMGYFDEDGYLFLTGRSAELIISGGVNIYPQEIDSAVMQHPAVLDLCTVGVPNEEWGEEVRTVIQLVEGQVPDASLAEEIMAFARQRLPGFKCPRSIDFREHLPRLPSGKIQRRLVREPYWAGRSRDI